MRRQSYFSICAVLFLAALVPNITTEVASQGDGKPFREYETIPLNLLLYPRIGTPAIVSDSGFTAWIKYDDARFSQDPGEVKWSVDLSSIYQLEGPFPLEVGTSSYDVETQSWEVDLQIPESVPEGLFNLTVYTEGVEETEPNSVYVTGSEPIERLDLAVFTDQHFGTREFYEPRRELTLSVINTLNSLRPDLIVTAGDNIDGTNDEETWRAYYELIMTLQLPILITPGNNDHYTYESGHRFFEKYLAPHYKSIDYGPYHFVSMDTDTGKIDWPPDDPYLGGGQLEWVEEDLAQHSDSLIRTVIFHHPYWPGEEELAGGERLPEVLDDGEVDLVLLGHRHIDEIRLPPEVPALTITTTSAGGSSGQHEGFRLLTFEGSEILYEEQSVDWEKLSVRYMQRNDGSSYGMAVRVINSQDETYDLRITAFLDSSKGSLTVREAELVRELQMPPNWSVVQARISAAPGTDTLVQLSYLEDTDPPTMTVTSEVTETTVELFTETEDLGLGVSDSEVFYSEDNSTWMDVEPTFIGGIPHLRFEATNRTMYYKGEVTDLAGLSTTVFGSVEISSLEPPPAESPALPLEVILGGVAVVVAILLIMVFLRRRGV